MDTKQYSREMGLIRSSARYWSVSTQHLEFVCDSAKRKEKLVKLFNDNEREGENLALKAGLGNLGKVLQASNGWMDGIR